MKTRPWPLYALSLMFFTIALSMPIQAFWIYDLGTDQFAVAMNMLTVGNWVVAGLLICNGLLILNASRWLMFTLPLGFLAVAINNGIVGTYSQDFSFEQAHMATVGFLTVHTFLFHPKVMFYLRNPHRRGWRVAERMRKKIELRIFPDCADKFSAKSFDVSTSGIFIQLQDNDLEKLQVGENLRIQLRFDSVFQITLDAKVVRLSDQARGRYPTGVGCQFESFGRKEKQLFSRLLEAS